MKIYRFKERLTEGIIQSRPNRFIMQCRVQGEIARCHCPVTGRIGTLTFHDVPCLLSRGTGTQRTTAYTVEAISLDPPERKHKHWIGINQTKANDYIGFFLAGGLLPKIAKGTCRIKREKKLGDSRIDFLVGRTYIEVKTPLTALPAASGEVRQQRAFNAFERLIKHYMELGRHLTKQVNARVILCYLYDAPPFKVPPVEQRNIRIQNAARFASLCGVENWQVNLKLDPDGVRLVRYFKLNLF